MGMVGLPPASGRPTPDWLNAQLSFRATNSRRAIVAEVDGFPSSPGTEPQGGQPATGDSRSSGIEIEVGTGPVTQDAVVLRVDGEVDVVSAPVLAQHLDRHFAVRAPEDTRLLVLDLSGVTFLASAGLAVLANTRAVAARRGVEVRLVASSRIVLRPLELTGLDLALPTVPDVASAMVRD